MLLSPSHPLSTLPIRLPGTAEASSAGAAFSSIRAFTEALARGDEAAFEHFHNTYFERLYSLLLVICRGQEQEAREALQQTLLRVLKHAKPFDSEEVFWSWLTALARSCARDGGRKLQRYQAMLQRFAQSWAGTHHALPDPAGDLESLQSVLLEALNELPEPDRNLVCGKYLSGHTVRELATAAGLTEKALESRLIRLRRWLRQRVVEKLREL